MSNPLYKIVLFICLAVVGLLLVFYAFQRTQYSPWEGEGGVPPQPSASALEAAAEIPKVQCDCWNEAKTTCLPEENCL